MSNAPIERQELAQRQHLGVKKSSLTRLSARGRH